MCLVELSSISFPSSSHLQLFDVLESPCSGSPSVLSFSSLAVLELVFELLLELELFLELEIVIVLMHLKTASLPASTVRLVTWATSCLLGGNKLQNRFTFIPRQQEQRTGVK